MKPIRIVYVMFEASNSTYAESYFIPLIKGLAQRDDSVLFIRITEKVTTNEVTITNRSQYFTMVDAHIGMFNFTNIKSLMRLVRTFLAEGNGSQRLIICRGINTFWTSLNLGLLTRRRSHFVYDSDGLSADEAIEFRRSLKRLILYFPARIMEACLLWRADLVLTRSKATKKILQGRMPLARNRPYVELNNGCDPSKYIEMTPLEKKHIRADLGLSELDTVFVYLGSYGPQYEFEKMLFVFSKIQIPDSEKKLLIFVPANDVSSVKELVEKYEINPSSYIVRNAEHNQTPSLLAASDFGFSLRQESFSMNHVKPLKTREYLSSGLSVIYSECTGDAAGLPEEIGFVLQDTGPAELTALTDWVQRRMMTQEYFHNLAKGYALTNLSIDNDISLLSAATQNMLRRNQS